MLKIIINEGCILLKQHFLVCQYEENLINEMQKKNGWTIIPIITKNI